LSAAISQEFPQATFDLVSGRRGDFTVVVNGRELWNKLQTGDFPTDDHILRMLRDGPG